MRLILAIVAEIWSLPFGDLKGDRSNKHGKNVFVLFQTVKLHSIFSVRTGWHLTISIFSILASSSAFCFEVWPVASGCWPDWSGATGLITMELECGVNESLWNAHSQNTCIIWFKRGSSIWRSQNKWCLFLSTCTSFSCAIHTHLHVFNPKWRVCKRDWTGNCFLSVSTMFFANRGIVKAFPWI